MMMVDSRTIHGSSMHFSVNEEVPSLSPSKLSASLLFLPTCSSLDVPCLLAVNSRSQFTRINRQITKRFRAIIFASCSQQLGHCFVNPSPILLRLVLLLVMAVIFSQHKISSLFASAVLTLTYRVGCNLQALLHQLYQESKR